MTFKAGTATVLLLATSLIIGVRAMPPPAAKGAVVVRSHSASAASQKAACKSLLEKSPNVEYICYSWLKAKRPTTVSLTYTGRTSTATHTSTSTSLSTLTSIATTYVTITASTVIPEPTSTVTQTETTTVTEANIVPSPASKRSHLNPFLAGVLHQFEQSIINDVSMFPFRNCPFFEQALTILYHQVCFELVYKGVKPTAKTTVDGPTTTSTVGTITSTTTSTTLTDTISITTTSTAPVPPNPTTTVQATVDVPVDFYEIQSGDCNEVNGNSFFSFNAPDLNT